MSKGAGHGGAVQAYVRAVGATLGESKEGKARRVRKMRGEAQCARRKREREMRLKNNRQNVSGSVYTVDSND